MAALVLTAGAALAGPALGLGAIATSVIGIGASVAGQYIDAMLFGQTQRQTVEGPRLQSLELMTSTEGAAIPRGFGRFRVAGQVIWMTRLEEEIVKDTTSSGGKGATPKVKTTTITYNYYVSLAVALCEGEIASVNRAWADGKDLSLSDFEYRVYTGSETQLPDSLIEEKEGTGNAPAYRGTAYIVFERMPLGRFGNRVPQMNFEVFKPLGGMEQKVLGVDLIPACTEFGYDPSIVSRVTRDGDDEDDDILSSEPDNAVFRGTQSDWSVSMEHLAALLPNVETVYLVVAWFGDDLRAGACSIRPKVENAERDTEPYRWRVSNLTRDTALVLPQSGGSSVYGGSPNDASVIRAIADLKERGYRVVLYPFIAMDQTTGNGLPDPYGGAEQAPFPWRGRITCHPAAGQPGTVDKTAAAATQIAALAGTAAPGDYDVDGDVIAYTGPGEWSFRRFILHYAHLVEAAGGVDGFLIGSELIGLTTVRSDADTFPFVDALVGLAADVKTILTPGTQLSYAADWSEYHSHRPTDGTGDIYFHLDPLWSSADIDFIAIDNYLPLSDWRDGTAHLDYDAVNGPTVIYDPAYLAANIEGGEHYDFYYASTAARIAQTRMAIADTDPAAEHWVFRNKDIRNWWLHAHHDRPAGVRNVAATGFVPQGKPIRFTEMGCPAVDKGTNQPNVFFDPKSSESALPWFSSGARDDFMQRRYVEVTYDYWSDPANNPDSTVYHAPMLDLANCAVWSWDARPFPVFPGDVRQWADVDNWQLGHWISGRASAAPLPELMDAMGEGFGFTALDTDRLHGQADGYVLDRIMTMRDATAPLELMYAFDLAESGDRIRMASRVAQPVRAALGLDDLIDAGPDKRVVMVRAQETDLPRTAMIRYTDGDAGYRPAAATDERQTGDAEAVAEGTLAVVADQSRAQAAVSTWLRDAWAVRERAQFALPPSLMRLEPGDVVSTDFNGVARDLRLLRVADGISRRIEARRHDRSVLVPPRAPKRTLVTRKKRAVPKPVLLFLDLPLLSEDDDAWRGYLASSASPWPGSVAVLRSADATGDFAANASLEAPADYGRLTQDFHSGPTDRYDLVNTLSVRMFSGTLTSRSELPVLAGANSMAVERSSGVWEIVQWRDAALVSPATYELTRLLRGQLGTDGAIVPGVPVVAGARCVLLDRALVQAAMTRADVGLAYWWKFGAADADETSYAKKQHTFTGAGMRPYSPVHLSAVRDYPGASNDVTLSWIRRTRVGGDNWDSVEVPLGEETQSYEIDIYDGSDILRTLSVAAPSAIYTLAQQTADFGAPPASIDFAVYQLSQTYGRGTGRRETIDV
ncbi:glycoside hydrolase/phage tail family protein [soil metagenome]